MGFEMFKEFEDDVSGALALFLVGVGQFALAEDVVKGNGRFQLFGVELNFANAAHYILFERNYKRSVILVRHVQKRVRVAYDLIFGVSDLKKR